VKRSNTERQGGECDDSHRCNPRRGGGIAG
jgi:hypothetical protein